MNCKSCDTPLLSKSKFCSNCGSKIVEDRLSLKGTWEEFVGPFFSWDNNFWRTFFGLFTKPKDVLEAYINGARKKYFNPFSYLILYTTVAVLFYKFFNFPDINSSFSSFNKGLNDPNVPQFNLNEFYNNTFNYYNFIIILSIPIYSFLTYLTFKKNGNNFFEHLVFNAYIQAHIGYILIITQILLFYFPSLFFITLILFSICYSVYVFKKLYSLSAKQVIISILKFWLFALLVYIILSVIIGGIFILKMLLSK